ncbi:Ger(x)C family spore germination protein [Alkalihalophilus pseudofirmus]|uniref:Ger(x)C family spore germination protein n=1 Tax=Alkalihalophilus pseudofirmus TaxID=79885 RepID=UPI0009D66ABF|nr:Ger(x)C family spore germination protein [Alkalihalophilus pseudofirmus]
MRIIRGVTCLFFLLLSLTGCWDRAELEEVGFVIGVAFDPSRDNPKVFDSTFHIAIPSAFGNGHVEGGTSGVQPFFNITSSGSTNFKMIRNINSRRSRSLNFEHLKVIVINEELARQDFITGVLDLYTRDHEMRRKTHVLISNGAAKDVYIDKLPLEDMPGISMDMIDENNQNVLGMIDTREIGMISEKVAANSSYLIPGVYKPQRGDLRLSGAAIINGSTNKMMGWLDEGDVRGYNWVIGEAMNGILEAEGKNGDPFVFEILSQETKLNYKRENGKNVFDVHIKAEGTFAESWMSGLQIDDPKALMEIEKILEAEIKKQSQQIVTKMQEEYYCDIFSFQKLLKRKNYHYWKETKDRWEGENGLFKDTVITIHSDVLISHYMTQEKVS